MTAQMSIMQKLHRLSDWIDEHIFPVPEYSKEQKLAILFTRQRKIEESAQFIRRQIRSAKKLRHTRTIFHMIENFRKLHGHTSQGTASCDSLHLDNYNKQQQIMQTIKSR